MKAFANDPALVLTALVGIVILLCGVVVVQVIGALDAPAQPAAPAAPDMTQRQAADVQVSTRCSGLFVVGSCNATTETAQQQAQAPAAAPAPNAEHEYTRFEMILCCGMIGFAMLCLIALAMHGPGSF